MAFPWVTKTINRLTHYASRGWYAPVLGLLSALDAYILIVPNETLLIPAVLIRPKRWLSTSLWVTLGSAIGATSFAMLASHFGDGFIQKVAPELLHAKTWLKTTEFLNAHSVWGLALISFSPFPQHVAVAIVGLAHVPPWSVFGGVCIGRAAKYAMVAACTVYMPHVLKKIGMLPDGIVLDDFPTPGRKSTPGPAKTTKDNPHNPAHPPRKKSRDRARSKERPV